MNENTTELLESAWRQRAEHLERCLAFLIHVIAEAAGAVGDREGLATKAMHEVYLCSIAVDLEAPLGRALSSVRSERPQDDKHEVAMNTRRKHVRAALASISQRGTI